MNIFLLRIYKIIIKIFIFLLLYDIMVNMNIIFYVDCECEFFLEFEIKFRFDV